MKLHFIQLLRAVAAWLVITDHALLNAFHNQSPNSTTRLAWSLGSSGVYLFFIISGFIMVHISWGTFGQWSTTTSFLRRRLIRIVPLYWAATAAAFTYHKISETHGAHAGLPDLLYSFAFIPHANYEGSWDPVLPQGWTLSYEMLFYGIFALALSLPRQKALPLVAMTLTALVIAGPIISNETLAYLASPIVLWFLLGIALGTLWHRRGLREPRWLLRSAKPFASFGDASYSTYLVHGLILTGILRIWLAMTGSTSAWIVPSSLIAATLAGWIVHYTVEKPILRAASNFGKSFREVGTVCRMLRGLDERKAVIPEAARDQDSSSSREVRKAVYSVECSRDSTGDDTRHIVAIELPACQSRRTRRTPG
jgi:exopolysaccharide production protein ExoZ